MSIADRKLVSADTVSIPSFRPLTQVPAPQAHYGNKYEGWHFELTAMRPAQFVITADGLAADVV